MVTAIQVDGLSCLESYQAPAGTSHIPSLQIAGADSGTGMGAFGGSVDSTGLNNCCLSEGRGLFDGATLLSVNMPFSGCGSLSRGRASSMDHVVCPPTLNSKGSSYCNCPLFGKSTVCIVSNCSSIGVYLIPNPRTLFPFAVFARMPSPCLQDY